MKQRSMIAAAVASILLFGGCNKQGENAQSGMTPSLGSKTEVKPENAIATVNGEPISKSSLEVMTAELEQRRAGKVPEDKLIDDLITRELLKQEADKQKLASDPANAARIEFATRNLLAQLDVENFVKNVQISDEDARKEYDQRIAAMKQTEYKAAHILVDNEATAKEIIAKLEKGAKFEELAKKFSKDPGSKQNGGELGWFAGQQMVAPFTEAVASLKNGEYTKTPVQTQFGWHIIQREDSREQKPPAFDDVKEQIRSMLKTQKLQQHVAELKAAAKIDRPTPAPTPVPAEPTPPAASTSPTPAAEGKAKDDSPHSDNAEEAAPEAK